MREKFAHRGNFSLSLKHSVTVNRMSRPLLTPPAKHTPGPFAADAAMMERLVAYGHRRKYPARTDVFRPGDPAHALYYILSGSASILTYEDDDRELVLGYLNAGEFVGEMGLFVSTTQRDVALRTRSVCELIELRYERLHAFLQNHPGDAARLLYSIGAQLSQRLLNISRKAGRLAFLDTSDRIYRTLFDLAKEPDAMSHPLGTQLRVSRQELAKLVGCSREMAGRVLKQLQADGKLHARGKTVVVYGTR